MKKLFFLLCFMAGTMSLSAQTIYYWRNDQGAGDNASWSSTSPYYFWNGSAGAVPTGAEIIQFEGSTGVTTINDLVATNRFKLNFYNSTVSHTLNGTTTNVFNDYGGVSPLIQNWTGVLQTINFPFQIGNESALNYAYGMHIWAGSGGLNIGSTISAANATGGTKELVLTAGASQTLTLSGVISDGSGAIKLTKWGAGNLLISAADTYTGTTTVNDGAIWIENGGSIANSSSISLGNAATTVAKFYLSSLTGGTTFTKAININAGNSGTRIIGGQNTSGTNIFSGAIGSSKPLSIDVPNSGGTVTVSGNINATNVTKIGSGLLNVSGTNTLTGNWLVEQGTMSFAFFGTNLNAKPLILGNATEVGTLIYTGSGGAQTVPISTNAGGGKFINSSSGDLSITPGTQTQTIAGNFEIACNSIKNVTLAYILTGAGGLKVSSTGTGVLTLSRANTYSGATTINSGTLTLGVANAIPSGVTGTPPPQSAVTINGGTLSTGAASSGFSCGTSTYPMGVLTVGVNGGTIALAATTSTQNLYFANSSAATWGGGTLTITGWSGTVGGTGTNGHIYIGTGTGALTDAQLSKIIFSGYSGHAMLLSTGELVPLISPKYFSSGNFASPNSWTETSAAAMTAITGKGPNFNTTYYHSTTSNNTGTDYFKFFSNVSGSGSYYGPAANSSVALSTSFSMSTANRVSGASYTITGINGERHVFKTIGTTAANASAVVFDLGLSGVVQTISSVTQSPASGSVYPGFATTVTANISGAFTGSQQAYLRYSTSSTFATSTVVAMAGSGTTYSADIPSGTNVAGTPVYYYVFTSGSAGTNPASDGSDADLFAINYNDNAGANYAYTPLASIPAITFTVASPGSGSSGYVGNTITVSGANLSGVNSLKIGGSGGTTVSSFTVVNSTTITFNAIDATGTIWLSDGTNTASSAATYTNLGYMSNADADWNTGSTWLGGSVPSAGSAVQIANAVTLNSTATNNPVSVTINSGKSLTLGASGALTINAGGLLTNNGNASLGTNGTVSFAGSATITGVTTFNNLTLNGTTTFNNAPTVNGTLTLNSGTTLVTNSPVYGASSVLKYNLNNGYGAKYNTSLEWPASSGPSSVILTTNSWVQLTGDRSLTGNLTITSGALQATGALRTLTMNGTAQTITVSTTSGGAIYGTDNGINNDLQLTVANGSSTTFTGDATSTDDDEKKFFTIAVNSGGTLALARGILCKWGTFTVNGTLKINANGYIQSNNTSNSAATTSNKAADYSGGGTLVYNNGGPYSTSDKEWPTTNSPANVTIQNSGTNVSLNNSKTISGTLTLTDGTLTTDANTLNIAGSIAATSGVINTGVTGTLAFAGASEQTLSSSVLSSGSVNNLTINAGSKLTTSGTIAATTLNILSSLANGTGTLKDGGTLTAASASVQQFLSSARNWYVSSPITNANAPSGYTYFKYDEPGNNTGFSPPASAYWESVSVGAPLSPMVGYISQVASGTPTITFSGTTVNTGNKSIELTRTAGKTKEGFNLVGNPYPSFLNIDNLASNADIDKTYWYRSYNSGYVFDTYNIPGSLSTGNSGLAVSSYIPPMQAFWVRVSSGKSTATLNLLNANRGHQDNSNNKFRSPAIKNTNQQVIRLQVSNGTNSDEAIVYFNSNASNGFDDYDSPKMFSNTTDVPEIYTQAGTEKLVINGLNTVQYETEIPLGFSTGAANNFSISATEISNFNPEIQLILKDKLPPNTETVIGNGTKYNFSSLVASPTTDRFSLLLRISGTTTPVSNTSKLNTQVVVNASNEITILSAGKCNYAIYNVVGQKLLEGVTVDNRTVINDLNKAGIYVVKVSENGTDLTSRVIIR